VMPEGMRFPQNHDIWRPLVPDGWTYARESLQAMRRAFG